MLHYGYRIGSEFILFINLISTCLQTTYLTLYILITDNKVMFPSYSASTIYSLGKHAVMWLNLDGIGPILLASGRYRPGSGTIFWHFYSVFVFQFVAAKLDREKYISIDH